MFRTAASLVLIALASAAPVRAAEAAPAGMAADMAAIPLASDTDWSLKPLHLGAQETEKAAVSRGSFLPALYASYVGLNVYDAYSTTRGVSHGAVEANAALRGLAGKPAALFAVKGVATAVPIFVAERMWRQHRRVEAIAMMLVSNGLMAAVAAHNAGVLHHVR